MQTRQNVVQARAKAGEATLEVRTATPLRCHARDSAGRLVRDCPEGKGKGKADVHAAAARAEAAHLTEYVDLAGLEHFGPLFFICQDCAYACDSL